MEIINGYPYQTDGGEDACAEGAQCIICPDGSTYIGEITATEVLKQIIDARNRNPLQGDFRKHLVSFVAMAEAHVEDIETGVEDHTYEAADNSAGVVIFD